jgi:hypothetical protein
MSYTLRPLLAATLLCAAAPLLLGGCMFVPLIGDDFDSDSVYSDLADAEDARMRRLSRNRNINATEYDALNKQTSRQGAPVAPTLEELEASVNAGR